ncbi:MAG: hypothetical protein KAJ51_16860 [Thermoplasmata archaeon]|nr:hypothetical protein [Thermoplasmata archaeon]
MTGGLTRYLLFLISGLGIFLALSGNASAQVGYLFGFGLVICAVLILIPLILAILVAPWMFKDANRRDMNGKLWGILLIVASIIPWLIWFVLVMIVYLLVRRRKQIENNNPPPP